MAREAFVLMKIEKERIPFSVGDVYVLERDIVIQTVEKGAWKEHTVVCKGAPVRVARKSTEDKGRKGNNRVCLTVQCADGTEFKVTTDELSDAPIERTPSKFQSFTAKLKRNGYIIGGVLFAVTVSYGVWLLRFSPPMPVGRALILSAVMYALFICSIAFVVLTANMRGKDVLYSSQELRNELSKLLLAQCCEKAAMAE